MQEEFSRFARLVGKEAVRKLGGYRVAVFGVGGVGGSAAEALARSGIGAIDLIDNDRVSLSNLNRQMVALCSTLGKYKADVAAERILDINPGCSVTVHRLFYLPETADEIDLAQFDYIVDAIDTVAGKIEVIVNADRCGVPAVSAMGCGNRLDPSLLRLDDIYSTAGDPLARVMRRELKKRGVNRLKVVYSVEKAIRPLEETGESAQEEEDAGASPRGAKGTAASRRSVPGSSAFVPPAAGCLLASAVVRDLLGIEAERAL